MTSQRSSHLQRCNDQLRVNSWRNYQGFLERLCVSTEVDEYQTALRLLRDQKWNELLDFADEISSVEYSTPTKHRLCHQLSAVIRKYPFPKGSVVTDPKGRALDLFAAAEHRCRRVNQRFEAYDKVRSPHESALDRAAKWISYVLGPLEKGRMWEDCGFGNGASIGVHGDATNFARKFLQQGWTVSPSAFYYAYAATCTDPVFLELLTKQKGTPYYAIDPVQYLERFKENVRFVEYNNISFVPKTARVFRTIAVEPTLSGYVQKGIDVFIRKRLKRVGIDLSDQSLNMGLALFGSSPDPDEDPYATIDLSSASDSISIGLCKRLLPPEWFEFLNSTRSKFYKLNGKVKPYHKFVSMGNGFCFPLETLIFASLCHSVNSEAGIPDDFSVYGDDIIIRSRLAARTFQLLDVCGFKANTKKTFTSGPFRESCGADWFKGEDVRPLTLDYAFDSVENIFKFCNLAGRKDTWKCQFAEALEFLQGLVPSKLYYTRPYRGNVDTAFEVPFDVFLASPFSKWHREMQCWSWKELRTRPVTDTLVQRYGRYDVAVMAGALMGVDSTSQFTLRRKTSTKVKRVYSSGSESLWTPREVFRRADPSRFVTEFKPEV